MELYLDILPHGGFLQVSQELNLEVSLLFEWDYLGCHPYYINDLEYTKIIKLCKFL